MNRRTLLRAAASATTAVVAGCTGQSGDTTTTTAASETSPEPETATTDAPPSVEVSARDVSASGVSLRAAWRARAQRVLDPPGAAATVPDDGRIWLVVQLAVTNTGDSSWPATPTPFVLHAGDSQYEVVVADAASYFPREEAVAPDDTVSGWIAFQPPETADAVVLSADPSLDAATPAVSFTRDDTLSFPFDA